MFFKQDCLVRDNFRNQFLIPLLGALAFLLPTSNSLFASVDFEHPNTYIGNADWDGGLVLWVEVAQIPIGGGSRENFGTLVRGTGAPGVIAVESNDMRPHSWLRVRASICTKGNLMGLLAPKPLAARRGRRSGRAMCYRTLAGKKPNNEQTADLQF